MIQHMPESKIRPLKYRTWDHVQFWYGGNPFIIDSFHSNVKAANRRMRKVRAMGFGARVKKEGRFKGMVTVPQSAGGYTWVVYATLKKKRG